MTLVEILFLSIALGMDCLIVSFSQGLLISENRKIQSTILALTMGFFQALMPLIGYLITGMVYNYISPFAKPLVFGIFLFLGGKFILEALQSEEEKESEPIQLGFKVFVILGIATSIDALGAGISLKLTHTPLILSCGLIALGSYILSMIGFWSGNLLKKFNAKYLEISSGLILILLAIKALL